jgi:HSP20 family protein
MAIIRWNPASDLVNLHSELDRIFSDLTEGLIAPRGQGSGDVRNVPVFLPVDIERSDKALTVRASVPGFKPDEVSVTVDNGTLTIDARHQEEREDKEGTNMVRRERFTGRMYRQIALGEGVDSENVNARFENGELIITVPLTQRPQPRRIPVQSGDGSQSSSASGQQQELAGTRAQQQTAGAGARSGAS